MKASIIVPMYNEERYVARFLGSLQRQSYKELSPKDFELILIDDGSTDRTLAIAEGFRNLLKDKFSFVLLKPAHCGLPGKIRNYGAQLAKGEILIFVDADMMLDSEYIETLIQPILSGKEVGTCHGREYVANLNNKFARAWSNIRLKYNPNMRVYEYRSILKSIFLKSGGYVFNRGAFDGEIRKIQGISGVFVENCICYHNNPEVLSEIYKHSIWVGKSLLKSEAMTIYLLKYKYWIGIFFILSLLSFSYLLYSGFIYLFPLIVIGILFLLIISKTIQRAITEKYLSHLIFVPIVMSARGLGYFVGLCKYLLSKKLTPIS